MEKIPLFIHGLPKYQQEKYFVRVSVPFQQKALFSLDYLSIENTAGELFACQYKILSYWHDDSIKWVEIYCVLIHQESLGELYYLTDVATSNCRPVMIEVEQAAHTINTQRAIFSLTCDENEGLILKSMATCNELGQLSSGCLGKQQEKAKWYLDTIEYASDQRQLLVMQSLLAKGRIVLKDCQLTYQCRYTFYVDSAIVKIEFTLINTKGAIHPNGLWDLGDDNSCYFRSLGFDFSAKNSKKIQIKNHHSGVIYDAQTKITLTQFASGGENWQSINHVNAQGEVPLSENGFKVDTSESEYSGLRCEPTLLVANNDNFVAMHLNQFWQNFPKQIKHCQSKCRVSLFPDGYHELQPGEQKSHVLWMDFDADAKAIDWQGEQVSFKICQHYVEKTKVVAFYLADIPHSSITETIALGLTGDTNFFDKREIIDEYGWRNFGEIYADHEAEQDSGEAIFVSHYNNQYDPIFGLLNQYMISQNELWLELANDLARHVIDIDIYHTNEDKPEYNHGLFWHTDHYLRAETCSHRTFSSRHKPVYQGYTSGGGPGPQHCYTTGLTLYYFLSGDESAKQAVVNLAKWINNSFEGSAGFLAKLLAIKKSASLGVKNHITGLYPLDRGTGHFITAQLDAYELTNDNNYLTLANTIIQHTIHPLDNVAQRNLGNIELTWFYTVLLQSVGRFLIIKEQLTQFDDDFCYARDALLLYATWMLANEKPYLSQADKLEFPTTTWVAQELRKVSIFRLAQYFSLSDNQLFQKKAEFFLTYVQDTLRCAKHKGSTRVLVLLMQNIHMCYFGIGKKSSCDCSLEIEYTARELPNKYVKIMKLMLKELVRFSLKREIKWLSFRSIKCKKIFGKYIDETN